MVILLMKEPLPHHSTVQQAKKGNVSHINISISTQTNKEHQTILTWKDLSVSIYTGYQGA